MVSCLSSSTNQPLPPRHSSRTQITPGSLSSPIAPLLPNKLGFYHIANPDSETAFQEDPVFFSPFDIFFFGLGTQTDLHHRRILLLLLPQCG